jgi:hypothetical protein
MDVLLSFRKYVLVTALSQASATVSLVMARSVANQVMHFIFSMKWSLNIHPLNAITVAQAKH